MTHSDSTLEGPYASACVLPQRRPRIAFFDFPDVFEDFYAHYGVDHDAFATTWGNTGNHWFAMLLQRSVGDVTWYEFSLDPKTDGSRHAVVGCEVRFFHSSMFHRTLWRLFYLPRPAWRWRRLFPAYALLASYTASLSWPFMRALWRQRPDIVFVQDYASGRYDLLLALARLLGATLVARHAGSSPATYVGRFAKRWTIPAADQIIVSSRREAAMLIADFGVAPDRLSTILTPIDTTVFRPRARHEACRVAGLDAARRYLLYVGRLDDRQKRLRDLVHVFASLSSEFPDTDLLIVGEGNDGVMLQHLAAELVPGRASFQGWVRERLDLAHYYAAAECLVLPSAWEGFPSVVGEAMACGTPVVASDVGGVSEMVVDRETGWLISPGDRRALEMALRTALGEPQLLAGMRLNARRQAEARVAPAAVAEQLRVSLSLAAPG